MEENARRSERQKQNRRQQTPPESTNRTYFYESEQAPALSSTVPQRCGLGAASAAASWMWLFDPCGISLSYVVVSGLSGYVAGYLYQGYTDLRDAVRAVAAAMEELFARLRLWTPERLKDLLEHWREFLREHRDKNPASKYTSELFAMVDAALKQGKSMPPTRAATDDGQPDASSASGCQPTAPEPAAATQGSPHDGSFAVVEPTGPDHVAARVTDDDHFEVVDWNPTASPAMGGGDEAGVTLLDVQMSGEIDGCLQIRMPSDISEEALQSAKMQVNFVLERLLVALQHPKDLIESVLALPDDDDADNPGSGGNKLLSTAVVRWAFRRLVRAVCRLYTGGL